MGDLDYLVLSDESTMKEMGKLLHELGYEDGEGVGLEASHDVYIKPPYMEVEVHRRLLPTTEENHWHTDDIWDRLVKDEDNPHLMHMTPEDFYLFHLLHFEKHYSMGGSGIRSIIDQYYLMKNYGATMDFDYINKLLVKMNYVEFEAMCKNLAKAWFEDGLLNDELENENNEIKNTDTRFVLKYPVTKINDINEEAFTTEEKRFKINKKMAGILAGIMMATSIPIIAASTRKNNNSNESSSESISNISTTTSNESSTPSNQTTSIESSIQDELDKYSKIKYLTKDEYVELLKSAEKEMSNTSLTTEELAAFVTEVNKNVISPELKQILIESGVLNKDEEIARRVYLNAAEKVGMAMMNTYTLEANADLLSIPEVAEEFKEIQENSAKIHISKFVSEKSDE